MGDHHHTHTQIEMDINSSTLSKIEHTGTLEVLYIHLKVILK